MSSQTTCPICGKGQLTQRVTTYHFVESGLDNIYLTNTPVLSCKHCDEEIISIPNPPAILKSIAQEGILLKSMNLTGSEIRFLRKTLLMDVTKFARIIGVDRVTLSRWENNHENHSKLADHSIRLAYAVRSRASNTVLDKLQNLLTARQHESQTTYVFDLLTLMTASCESSHERLADPRVIEIETDPYPARDTTVVRHKRRIISEYVYEDYTLRTAKQNFTDRKLFRQSIDTFEQVHDFELSAPDVLSETLASYKSTG